MRSHHATEPLLVPSCWHWGASHPSHISMLPSGWTQVENKCQINREKWGLSHLVLIIPEWTQLKGANGDSTFIFSSVLQKPFHTPRESHGRCLNLEIFDQGATETLKPFLPSSSHILPTHHAAHVQVRSRFQSKPSKLKQVGSHCVESQVIAHVKLGFNVNKFVFQFDQPISCNCSNPIQTLLITMFSRSNLSYIQICVKWSQSYKVTRCL